MAIVSVPNWTPPTQCCVDIRFPTVSTTVPVDDWTVHKTCGDVGIRFNGRVNQLVMSKCIDGCHNILLSHPGDYWYIGQEVWRFVSVGFVLYFDEKTNKQVKYLDDNFHYHRWDKQTQTWQNGTCYLDYVCQNFDAINIEMQIPIPSS
jgi:hypothetical protein